MDYQYQTTEQPSSPRKAWPIVLAVVVALIVACGAGVCVYRNKQQEALATCRQSLAEFSSARKAVLDTSDTKSLDESKKELQQSIDEADKLVDKLSKDDSLTLTGRKLLSALSKAADSGQKLVESGNIKDSKYYKAAKVTLDEAIDMADNWVNSQAAKAQ